MAGVKRTSIEDVMKGKECVCGKKFGGNENKPNIKTHCEHCDTFKRRKKSEKSKNKMSAYFSVEHQSIANAQVMKHLR